MALTTYKVVHVGLPEPGAHNLPRSSPAVVPLPHVVRGSLRLLLLSPQEKEERPAHPKEEEDASMQHVESGWTLLCEGRGTLTLRNPLALRI